MLGRLAAAAARRSAVASATLPRAFAATSLSGRPQRSFHAGVPTREAAKEAAPSSGSALETVKALASDWKFAVPGAIVLGVPAFHLEIIQLSEETMLVACFMTFVAACYTGAGDMIHKALGEKGAAVLSEFRAMEASRAVKLDEQLKALSLQATLLDDMKDIYAMQDSVLQKMGAAKTMELQHMVYHDAIKRLEDIVATEARAMTQLQNITVQAVCESAEEALAEPFERFAFSKLALHKLTGSLGDMSAVPEGGSAKEAQEYLQKAAAAGTDPATEAFSAMLEEIGERAKAMATSKPSAEEKKEAYHEYLESLKLPVMPDFITWPTGLDKPEDIAMPMAK